MASPLVPACRAISQFSGRKVVAVMVLVVMMVVESALLHACRRKKGQSAEWEEGAILVREAQAD